MHFFEFKVYYEFKPTESTPFPLKDEDVERNLKLLPNDLEHFIPGSTVSMIKEDFQNKSIQIKIQTTESEEEVLSQLGRALAFAKLFGERI